MFTRNVSTISKLSLSVFPNDKYDVIPNTNMNLSRTVLCKNTWTWFANFGIRVGQFFSYDIHSRRALEIKNGLLL